MIDPLQFPGHNRDNQPQETGREQLPGESVMWFNRYCLYRDMGFKRSLRGAVALERARLHPLPAQELATTSPPDKKLSEQVSYKGVLQSVAPVKQVPGNWKDAAKKWRWLERARAYEAGLLVAVSEHQLAQLSHTYANKFMRIRALNEMIETTRANSRRAAVAFPIEDLKQSHHLVIGYTKQLRGLLADLRAEMKDVDEQALLTWIQLYNNSWPDQLERTADKK